MSGHKLTAHELAGKLNEGTYSLADHSENVSRLCTTAQQKFNAFINYDPLHISKERERLAASMGNGVKLPLAGVPFALADNICTATLKTTCASRMLASYQPLAEEGAARKLRERGAILVGKTNMDEFSVGASGKNSFFGAVMNPHDQKYAAGSGAAAAVAGGAVSFALATDRWGELRQAASYCGVMGLKPTYGRISRQGLIDSAPSLEQAGIIAAQIPDLAAALDAVCGFDVQDPTSAEADIPDFSDLQPETLQSVKIAVLQNWNEPAYLEEGVRDTFAAALQKINGNIISVEAVALDHFHHACMTASIISAVEAFSNLSNYDGVRFGFRGDSKYLHDMYRQTRTDGFGTVLKQFLTFGALVSAGKYYEQYFLKAQKLRSLIKSELEDCLQQCDLIVLPATPTKAPLLENGDLSLLSDVTAYYTAAANLAGLPALTLPLKPPGEVGPMPSAGLQLIGRAWDEKLLLQVGLLLEKEMQKQDQSPA